MKKILFATSHYFSGYTRVGAQNYALEFSNIGWKVAYVSTFLSLFKVIFDNDKDAIKKQWNNFIKGGVNIKDNLWTYVPFTLVPHHNYTYFDRRSFLNNYYKFTVPSIKHLIQKKGFDELDVLWLDCSHQNFWRKILKPKCVVYRVADNIKGFQNTGSNVVRAEEEAILFSDITIVASKVLCELLQEKYKHKKIVYCPNGVDLSNFLRDKYDEPDEYKLLKGKKALYVGAIEQWLDVNLLKYLAKNSPTTNFIIIGYDKKQITKEFSEDNILYLGPKNPAEVPNYVYFCDYGIIPFKATELVQTVNPIKMYEFFSLGKPVVSSCWKELELLAAPCLLAKNKKEFLDIIQCEKKLNCYDKSFLTSYAKQNSWRERVIFIKRVLEEYGI